jgi:hypothetical protein
MAALGLGPLRLGRVVAVVASEVQVGQVHQRVPAVLRELAVAQPQARLHGGQLRLVVRVRDDRPAEARDPGLERRVRQVLQLAVVGVQPHVLASGGDRQVADRAQPRMHRGSLLGAAGRSFA